MHVLNLQKVVSWGIHNVFGLIINYVTLLKVECGGHIKVVVACCGLVVGCELLVVG